MLSLAGEGALADLIDKLAPPPVRHVPGRDLPPPHADDPAAAGCAGVSAAQACAGLAEQMRNLRAALATLE